MPVSIKVLKRKGVSSGAYKKIFTMQDADLPPLVKKLKDSISSRIRDGYTSSLRDYKTFHAIDLAYAAPFNQTTPTLVQNILSKDMSAEDIMKELENWGLKKSDLFLEVDLPQKGGKQFILNPPVFNQILIPIVKAYLTIRGAKLFNERNKDPILSFEPSKNTPQNQVLCEVLTDIVCQISSTYGYASVIKQAINQMLRYGTALGFTREEWHYETQTVEKGGVEHDVVVKEGLRYIFPHPTRMFYDLQYPLTTLNTDSGCEFLGHWRVMRFGDVLDNRQYWNRKSIAFGTDWFSQPIAGNYFREVFPCQLKFPIGRDSEGSREERMAFYASGDRDKATFVTEFYWKLNPKKWGLADYDHPVWHHFTVAGDDAIIFAEPCAYCPAFFMGYDHNDNDGQASSMALETIPWQDHLGNTLTQIILTAKQNLANVIYYDSMLVKESDIEKLQNAGETKYRGMNFIPYDSMKHQKLGADVRAAFHRVDFGYKDITQLMSVLNMTLNIMERVLQISAQEAGAAASHQQSAREIAQIGSASSQRVNYTGSFVDDGIDGMKRQIFNAALNYLEPDFFGEVSAEIPDVEAVLASLGMKVEAKTQDGLVVSGVFGENFMQLESFAKTGVGANDLVDPEQARAWIQSIQLLSGNPEVFQKVGAKNVIRMIEHAAVLSGSERDFRLHVDESGDSQQQAQQIQQQVTPMLQQLEQSILQKVGAGVAQPVAGELQKIQATLAQLEGIYQIAKQANDADQKKAQEAQQRMAIREAEHQQAMKQSQELFQVELSQRVKEAEVKIQSEIAKAVAKANAAQIQQEAKAGGE